MIAQTAMTPFSAQTLTATVMGAAMTMRQTCVVQLFDRRTGSAHRINGNPLMIFTRQPEIAVADLLEGRDPAKWEARVQPLISSGETS